MMCGLATPIPTPKVSGLGYIQGVVTKIGLRDNPMMTVLKTAPWHEPVVEGIGTTNPVPNPMTSYVNHPESLPEWPGELHVPILSD